MTSCIFYVQYYNKECNPAVYTHTYPAMSAILLCNVIISIMFKFGSVLMLRIALEEYENMSKNASCFLFAILLSLAPNTMLAPIYTYDHLNCMPRNFLIN